MKLKELKQIKLKGGNKKIMKVKIKQERGITLIALVVTIVVLLILAGVSINAIFNDNGIIARAQDAQNKMNEAQQKDLNSINELNNWIENQTSGNTQGGSTKPEDPANTNSIQQAIVTTTDGSKTTLSDATAIKQYISIKNSSTQPETVAGYSSVGVYEFVFQQSNIKEVEVILHTSEIKMGNEINVKMYISNKWNEIEAEVVGDNQTRIKLTQAGVVEILKAS